MTRELFPRFEVGGTRTPLKMFKLPTVLFRHWIIDDARDLVNDEPHVSLKYRENIQRPSRAGIDPPAMRTGRDVLLSCREHCAATSP
jgi:hypothetical protein